VIGPSGQGIGLPHTFTRPVVQDEVKPGKEKGPPGLPLIDFFCGHEVLQALMISPDFEPVLGSL
jgi:hypothetical protein